VPFALEKWDSQALPALMEKYQASPEVFFQRFNVIIKHFGLERVFFMRFIHHLGSDKLEVDKELQINRKQQPHAAGLAIRKIADALRSVTYCSIVAECGLCTW
jgi:hypothetical protein